MVEPIKIWVSAAGPNPWKPVIILEKLALGPDLRKLNPSGKVPVMEDPNTELMLWESGAIVLYLIDQYDTEKKLVYTTLKEKNLLNQWLMFQMSQQGPYYGQIGWFNYFHPEKLPSVVDRYVEQAERVLGVLNGALEGKTWLVGDKCTYADLSFFMWNVILPLSMLYPAGETPLSKFSNVLAWHDRMQARESVKKTLAVRQGIMDAEGLGNNALRTDLSLDDMSKKLSGSNS
ncbi:glutathione S-transferase [Rhizodiscina lignyota]|uniref:glutathione transferase n=1 Tax=Rhizodiscina lignyota TaxID=1504668 RepID=A0A9P4INC9_9PEZI|nr:glutathione S-transferase [Rhizodiscina lignyota]